ncbi:MAG: hypothetical protein KJ062_17170 [Thermoanaerobaculia bacterium]|nr:hypothetical protein [Thermoanaerobaculia bacterium]
MALADGLREYMTRDWAAVRESKECYWSEELSAADRIRLAESLRLSVLAATPAWPSEEDRVDDLDAHEHLAGKIRRAGTARPR